MSRVWRVIGAGSGSGRARGLLRIWAWYERLDLHLHPNRPIAGAPRGVFQVTLVEYRDDPFTLPDGTQVKTGDLVCRLHISNPVLMQVVPRGTWQVQSAMMGDLRALARSMERGDLPPDIRALFGVTILARASSRLGFIVRPRRRTLKAYLDRIYRQGLLALYCPRGVGRLAHRRTLASWPDEVWISRAELVRRYGQA
jgi:hypothetical protein